MLVLALILLGLVILIGMGWVSSRFGTVWHPLLIPLGTLFVMAAAAPIAQQIVLGERVYPVYQFQAAILTILYVCAICLPFLTDRDPVGPLIERLMKPLEVVRVPNLAGGYQFASLMLFAFGGVAYLLLVANSPRGWDWIFSSRIAYQTGRSGVGHWYVFAQGLFLLAYLSWLWFCEIRSWKIFIPVTFILACSFWFFGSKQGMVGVMIAGGFYSNYFIRPMSTRLILLAGACLVPLVVLSPWLQGNYTSLEMTLSRYYDYFDNSALYLQHQDDIGYQYGRGFLSSFWEYVPRGLYSGKPYVYGQLIVNDKLWPGAAEQGHTPALLPWVIFHLDFGLPGVILGGVISGLCLRGVYAYFLKTRSYLALLLVLQICFTPVLKHTPLVLFVFSLVGLSVLFKLTNFAASLLQEPKVEEASEEESRPVRSPSPA